VFPDTTIYVEHLPPTGIVFPNFHIIQLQITPRKASKLQIRNQWRNFNYFYTVKYRVFDGLSTRPPHLLRQLDHVGEIMYSNIETITLNNAVHTLQNVYYEKEPESGVGLTVGAFYFNVDVLLKVPHEPLPLQEHLTYTIETKSGAVRTGTAPKAKWHL